MTTAARRSPPRTARGLVGELRRRNRALFAVAALHLALAVLFTALMAVDSRTLLGRNVWTKPWKFATSITVYTATVGWLLPSLSLSDRLERRAGYAIGAAMCIEIALISTQAARGVRSHFNASTLFDGAVAALMGTTITLNTLVVAYLLWRTVRNPPDHHPAYLWGLLGGLGIFVAASLEGSVMVGLGSHAVGTSADAAGIPLLNWKVEGGDLRVAHFVGLHALQALPFVGYVAARRTASTRRSLLVVGAAGALYAGLVAVTFAVAMLGHPVVPSL